MIFGVTHEAFQTDHLGYGTTYVRAESADEARRIFNEAAAKRRKYPYVWSDALVVEPLELLNDESLVVG